MARPLRSTPITGASPLLQTGPPAHLASVLTPHGHIPLGYSLSPESSGRYRDTPSHVPCRSPRSGSCRLHAGHRLASHRVSARLIPQPITRTTVLMPLENVTTRQQRFGFTHLPDPHLTPLTAPFPHRSPRRSSANAACGGLKPPPERRLRRAKPSSPAQHRFLKTAPTLRSPFLVRGTRHCVVG